MKVAKRQCSKAVKELGRLECCRSVVVWWSLMTQLPAGVARAGG